MATLWMKILLVQLLIIHIDGIPNIGDTYLLVFFC